MAHAQIRNNDIKFTVGERQFLRIGRDKRRVRYATICKRQHRGRKINAGHIAAPASKGLGGIALAATKIERLPLRSRIDGIQQATDRLVGSRSKQFNVATSAPGIGPACSLKVSKCFEVGHHLRYPTRRIPIHKAKSPVSICWWGRVGRTDTPKSFEQGCETFSCTGTAVAILCQ